MVEVSGVGVVVEVLGVVGGGRGVRGGGVVVVMQTVT